MMTCYIPRDWVVTTVKGPILDSAYVVFVRRGQDVINAGEKLYSRMTIEALINTLVQYAVDNMDDRSIWDEDELSDIENDIVIIFVDVGKDDPEFANAKSVFMESSRLQILSKIDTATADVVDEFLDEIKRSR